MLLATRTEQEAEECGSPTKTPGSEGRSMDGSVSEYYTLTTLDVTPDDNNEMTTSFSNPNYGLDALNSNCLLPSVDHASHDDVIVDNVTSLTSNRCYATDNGLPFQQGNQSTTRCDDDDDDTDDDEEDEEEDSAVEMRPAPNLSVLQDNPDVDDGGVRGGSVDSIDTLSPSADHSDPSAAQATSGAGGKDQSITTPPHIRDVYSPDSNDSGIVADHSMTSRRYRHVTNPEPETAETSDEKSRPQQASGGDEDATTELPTGWEKHEDECGAYYWHIKSGTIQRERPTPSSQLSRQDKRKETANERSRSQSGGCRTVATSPMLQSPTEPTCLRCTYLDDADGSYPIRFAVRSLGWVEMKDEELNAEHSGKAVNRCIVGLSVGKNDVNDVVGRWGDGKSLYLELDEETVTLIDPQDLSVLNVQPIQSIRVWGVGRNNGRERDFAYVARDCVTRKHMCHVFRCDGLARHIANALRDICRRILAERSARAAAVSTPADGVGLAAAAGGRPGGITRPNNLPNLSRVSGDGSGSRDTSTGELLTFESIYKNTSFPTPMEEPKKIVRCHYLGTTLVHRPTGVDVLNNAMDNVYTRALPEKWIYVNVSVAPSTITITEYGKSEKQLAECRVRFLSFMGIAANNVRLCGFIMHCAQDQFVAHVFHCDPSAGALCKTIEAACKLRYQKCLDAHARSAVQVRRQAAQTERESKGLRHSIRQGVHSVFGNLTKGCKP